MSQVAYLILIAFLAMITVALFKVLEMLEQEKRDDEPHRPPLVKATETPAEVTGHYDPPADAFPLDEALSVTAEAEIDDYPIFEVKNAPATPKLSSNPFIAG